MIEAISRKTARTLYSWFLASNELGPRVILGIIRVIPVKLRRELVILNFLIHLKLENPLSYSQYKQDVFVSFLSKTWIDPVFLEIGAGDGVSLSNSYLLESLFGWNGTLIEPNQVFETQIKATRTAEFCAMAITTLPVEFLRLHPGKRGEFSKTTIDDLGDGAETYLVKTIQARDLFLRYEFADLSYLSLDIEGNEELILEEMFQTSCRPFFITVEHNFDSQKMKILRKLAGVHNYILIGKSLSEVDYWFIRRDVHENFCKNYLN